jgi:hypothetical protein
VAAAITTAETELAQLDAAIAETTDPDAKATLIEAREHLAKGIAHAQAAKNAAEAIDKGDPDQLVGAIAGIPGLAGYAPIAALLVGFGLTAWKAHKRKQLLADGKRAVT